MGIVFVIALLVGHLVIGLTIWGFISKTRSLSAAIAGVMVMLCASLGAWHAWGESQSLGWAIGYLAVAIVGAASAAKQAIPQKAQPAR